MFHHQRTPGVALAGVLEVAITPVSFLLEMIISNIHHVILISIDLAPVEVASTDHLVVDDHVDALLAVPLLALPVVDHWHVHNLSKICER